MTQPNIEPQKRCQIMHGVYLTFENGLLVLHQKTGARRKGKVYLGPTTKQKFYRMIVNMTIIKEKQQLIKYGE